MNRDSILAYLEEYLGTFRCHASLFGEIAGIIAKSGYERAGKRTSDYTPYIPAAKERLDHERSLFDNEQFRI